MTISDQPGKAPHQRSPMVFNRASVALLLFAISINAVLVIWPSLKRHSEGDGPAYALLAATAQLGTVTDDIEYNRWPTGTWAAASTWERFARVEHLFIFRRIADDVGNYEAHPPMYFWLVHIERWLGLSHRLAITGLNLAFTISTLLLLYAIGGRVFQDWRIGAIAALFYAMSPAVIQHTAGMRQYSLLAALTITMIWWTLIVSRRLRDSSSLCLAKDVAGICALTALLLLTNFTGPLVCAACGLYIAAKHFRTDLKRVVIVAMAMTMGLGVFLILHPHFRGSFTFDAKMNRAVNYGEMFRVVHYFVGIFQFFALEPRWTRLLTGAVLVLILIIAFVLHQRPIGFPIKTWLASSAAGDQFLQICFVLMSICTIAYFVRALPQHAYGVQYFPGMGATLALLCGLGVIRSVSKWYLRCLVVLPMLVSAVAYTRYVNDCFAAAQPAFAALAGADNVVVDARVGIIERVARELKPEARMLAISYKNFTAADVAAAAALPGEHTVLVVGNLEMETADVAFKINQLIQQGRLIPLPVPYPIVEISVFSVVPASHLP